MSTNKKHITFKLLSIIIMLSLVFTIVLLTACDGDGDRRTGSSDDIEIIYWTHTNPAYVNAALALIEKFETENSGINVQHEHFSEFNTKIYSSFAAGTESDIIEMYGGVLRFAMGGTILPVPEEIMTNEQIEDTFWPATIENRYYEGRYYGLPSEMNIESPGLLVNLDLVAQANLSIPEGWDNNFGPSSWNELLDFANSLTVIENDVMMQSGLGVVGGEEAAMFLSLIWQQGEDYRDPDNMRVHFNTEAGVNAMQFILDLIEGPDRVHSTQFSGRFEGFMEQTVAMAIGAPWYAAVIDQEVEGLEYAYFNLPPFISGAEPFFAGEGGWGSIVSARTEHADATWRFAKFLTEAENQLYWASTVGSLPSRNDLGTDEYFVSGDGQRVLLPALQIAEYGVDVGAYMIDPYQLVWDIVYRNVDAIIHNEVDIETGLQNMEDEANDMVEQILQDID